MTDIAVPPWVVVVTLLVLVGLLAAVVVLLASVRRAARRTDELLAVAVQDTETLRAQLAGVEEELRAGHDVAARAGSTTVAVRDDREFVITDISRTPGRRLPEVPARMVPAPQFADILLREGVVRTVSLAAGLRRALSPEVRNRIRFEMKREVKRSRKERRRMLRQARRHWEARGRAEIELGS